MSGSIDGKPGVASGRVTYEFASGPVPAIELPEPAPGASFAPALPEASAPPPADWQAIALGERDYRIDMPGTPTITPSVVHNAKLGDLDQVLAEVTGPEGATFVAIDLAVPEAYISSTGASALAREVIDVEARNNGATVVGMRELDGTGPAGVEAVLARPNGSLIRIRAYAFDSWLLELLVIGDIDRLGSADADRFLASVESAP